MGVNLAVEEINAAGGVMGRKIELIAEDSVNPPTASTKAQRLIERDKVVAIIGEISSASGLAIAQVAQRNRSLFFNTGCNSDELRGKSCNRYMFHAEAATRCTSTRPGRRCCATAWSRARSGTSSPPTTRSATTCSGSPSASCRPTAAFAADDLVPTDAADFSAYLLKIRNAKPDFVVSNLAGAQITNFMKQYMEYGLPFPLAGFGFDTAVLGRRQGQRDRHLAARVGSQVKIPSAQKFTEAFTKKFGKPPDNQAWGDYCRRSTWRRR